MSQLDLSALFRSIIIERDKLCLELIQSALESRVALLFGSRQAGKSAVLRRAVQILRPATADAAVLGDLDVPVYVDLMRLPYDATPIDFFALLAQRAQDSCVERIAGFAVSALHSHTRSDASPDVFASDIQLLRQCAGEVSVRFIFLLDEAKRVLGHRFPRGFQDNLYALLFNPDLGVSDHIALVFSGAQHLYQFYDDDTSPLGSRAASHLIHNISEQGCRHFAELVFPLADPDLIGRVTEWVYSITSGQAGLTAALLRIAANLGTLESAMGQVATLDERLRVQSVGLVSNWASSFTAESRVTSLNVGARRSITQKDVGRILRDHNLDSFAADRVLDELVYSGALVEQNERYAKANPLLWAYIERLGIEETGSAIQREVWGSIEEAELVLREFVREVYEQRWAGKALDYMRTHLGATEWAKLVDMQKRSADKYPYSPHVPLRDEMSCMYLGQLLTLMVHGQAWVLFKDLFKDKRQLEDLLSAITPVRADRAHFNNVPDKELNRCKIACDDLVVIVDGHR